MATPPKPLTNLHPAERTYLRLVRAQGRPAPTTKRLDIQAPIADDGETDCWTHAWQVARRLREQGIEATYVEGICFRPSATGPSFHAWVEEANPLTGRVLVECTPGYERANRYLGIAVDCTPGGVPDRVTAEWTVRSSVIQAALAGGGGPEQVLAAVAPPGKPQHGPAARTRRQER